MFFYSVLISIVTTIWANSQHEDMPAIHIKAPAKSMPLYIAEIEPMSSYQETIMKRIVEDLSWSSQFSVHFHTMSTIPHKKDIQKIFEQGYALVLFITAANDYSLEWRLYDAIDVTMIHGNRYVIKEFSPSALAHAIAHDIWCALTALPDSFMSMITYIKKCHNYHEVWLSSFNGKDHLRIAKFPWICIAPSWDKNPEDPHIVISEFTPCNVRLRAINLTGKSKIIFDNDGTTVGISYAPLCDDVVYCRSGDIWRFHYDGQEKKGYHRLVIHENEPCAGPLLLSNNDIMYGYAGSIWLHKNENGTKALLTAGYCVGPAYNENNKLLLYSKREKGIMQLFSLNLETNKEQQLTFTAGDKTESSLSPCGNYVVCCHELHGKSRIMLIQINTGNISYITDDKDNCRYPCWSRQLSIKHLL